MSFWTNAEQATKGVVTEEDFEAMAYRLVSEQVLYQADRKSRTAYGVIREFEADFRRALAPLGILLKVNSNLRYVCAIPTRPKHPATVEQTLLALVLRKIHDEESRVANHNEDGEVECDLVTLGVKYRQASGGRELPSGSRLMTLMTTLRRWGIARSDTDDRAIAIEGAEQPYVVIIRPGIVEVIGEAALERLAAFGAAKAGDQSGEPSALTHDDNEGDDFGGRDSEVANV
ncbi:DUF4194 domain-containing protein [Schlegelella sp. S2-27]|uniref:DUF4194 domain-containing protein n=1 Tax=Caldimonas mangrovi TaxID=2944811 RepID=A0ABT0YN22_9BURK|nr:DUF4194 domain-containing protein [Caldimonas mangrovi]MCM5680110.1 DUF4194 domain-containing protein [Caldimonas mangrovi]